jgi:hypothetical protein
LSRMPWPSNSFLTRRSSEEAPDTVKFLTGLVFSPPLHLHYNIRQIKYSYFIHISINKTTKVSCIKISTEPSMYMTSYHMLPCQELITFFKACSSQDILLHSTASSNHCVHGQQWHSTMKSELLSLLHITIYLLSHQYTIIEKVNGIQCFNNTGIIHDSHVILKQIFFSFFCHMRFTRFKTC